MAAEAFIISTPYILTLLLCRVKAFTTLLDDDGRMVADEVVRFSSDAFAETGVSELSKLADAVIGEGEKVDRKEELCRGEADPVKV